MIKNHYKCFYFLFFHHISISDLSLAELKFVAKGRGIKGYRSMPEERLLSVLGKPKLIKNNFDNERLRKIGEDLNKSGHKLFKSKIKQISKKSF